MPKGTPVRATNTGDMDFIDVSVEAEALAICGVTSATVAPSSNGSVVTNGRVLNLTTSASFGDAMYIDKVGGLTNSKPSIGVAGFVSGDFVIYVGVIAKNVDNPLNKDLVVNLNVIGQL